MTHVRARLGQPNQPHCPPVYTKNQPLDTRKLGFGSHNAKNRDEFTLHIRTEQYRELLKVCGSIRRAMRTCSACAHSSTLQAEKKALRMQQGGKQEEDDDDAGDSFWETSAAEIGSGAKAVDLSKPSHGRVAVTKEFYDRGHLHS